MLKSVKEAIANQVNAGVSKAVSESLKPLQKSIDALVKSPTQAQDPAEALRLATAGIVRSIGADFDARLRLHTESLLARVDTMIKQQAAAPAPAPPTSTEPSAEVVAFIKAGNYDSALGLTLNENNLDLLMKVLAMLEADRVVSTLSHPVMLALIHWCVCRPMSRSFHNAILTLFFSSSLAVGLHIQQEAKLMWLTPTGSPQPAALLQAFCFPVTRPSAHCAIFSVPLRCRRSKHQLSFSACDHPTPDDSSLQKLARIRGCSPSFVLISPVGRS
jgi:hypothetical protein